MAANLTDSLTVFQEFHRVNVTFHKAGIIPFFHYSIIPTHYPEEPYSLGLHAGLIVIIVIHLWCEIQDVGKIIPGKLFYERVIIFRVFVIVIF